jgi:hypothetical protein
VGSWTDRSTISSGDGRRWVRGSSEEEWLSAFDRHFVHLSDSAAADDKE